jgi:tetratricopeptide (TPR) repeat protein
MKLDHLKGLARRYELREEWGRAIEVYQQALQQLAEAGEPAEPSLFNRIGDLELKVGDAGAALRAYERAADVYAELGFFNNAIAVCGKILRVDPSRTATYLRLAELNARKNVIPEARRNLTEYVDRMLASGQVARAIEPLRSFAARFGASPDLRATLSALLRDLEPRVQESELAKLAQEVEAGGGEGGAGASGTMERGAATENERSGVQQTRLAFEKRGAEFAGDLSGTGLVFLDPEDRNEERTAALLEPTALTEELVAEPIALEGFEPTQAGVVASSDAVEIRPLVEAVTPEPVAIPGLEPLEHVPPEEYDPSVPAPGPVHFAEPLFEALEATELDEAVDHGEPDEIAGCRHRVEQAYRAGDRMGLIAAYLALGDALERHGMGENAALVYRRVLEHDSHNTAAAVALRRLARSVPGLPGAPSFGPPVAVPLGVSEPAPVPTPEEPEYVDLGALILDPEPPRDTRMRVEAPEPVGDEDRDFEETLAQFKAGLEANVEETDFQTHYDLGIAFQEMGLLPEAIAQFQRALRAPEARLRSAEALGQCFFAQGRYRVAEAVLSRAVETLSEGDDAKIGLMYWWGRALEALGRRAEALRVYERALAIDITFLDLSERIQRLGMEIES